MCAKRIAGVLVFFLLLLSILFLNGFIGVPRWNLERDLRASQKIQQDWVTEGMSSGQMAAYLSYPIDKSDYVFSIYVNCPGLSFGYFFRGGGTIGDIDNSIVAFTAGENRERAFVSMNQKNVKRVEIDDGNYLQVMNVAPNKPFAIVLPTNGAIITFYDTDGNTVAYESYEL